MIELNSKEIKELMLNILLKFDKFCKDNDLKYYLHGGTLLGAIRHNGFIPWDDDIDVIMFRDDYNKMIEIFKKNQELDYLKFSSFEVDNSIYPFGKLYDSRTFTECSDSPFHNGIWIDIFPLDNVDEKDTKIYKKVNRNRKLLLSKMIVRSNNNKLKYIIKRIIKFCFFMIPSKLITKSMIKMSMKYSGIKTNYCANLSWCNAKRDSNIFSYNDYGNSMFHEFEGHVFPVPCNYDKILKQMYGNYLELPPIDKRTTHGFKAYFRRKESE